MLIVEGHKMIEKEASIWRMEELKYYKQLYQCNQCGEIHRSYIKKVKNLGNDIYYETYCPKCREVVKHLWVGQDESDIYMLADPIMDKRYY